MNTLADDFTARQIVRRELSVAVTNHLRAYPGNRLGTLAQVVNKPSSVSWIDAWFEGGGRDVIAAMPRP
ncbi:MULTISPECIES: hypothetical protein [Burkholderia]|uniref:hypothetical protein n=1 Tax=Burkholderia TaxID=32008 RepID=UPI0012BCF6F9|nr:MULTISPECIES: hypothetical protein [Burkholderia]